MENLDTCSVLKRHKVIAVVGCSRDPSKDAYLVPLYLKEHGYKIVPVNPSAKELLGEKCHASLLEIPSSAGIEIVNVFRPSADVFGIAQQALEMNPLPKVFWTQLGISDEDAKSLLEKAGVAVVMDRCLRVEFLRCFS